MRRAMARNRRVHPSATLMRMSAVLPCSNFAVASASVASVCPLAHSPLFAAAAAHHGRQGVALPARAYNTGRSTLAGEIGSSPFYRISLAGGRLPLPPHSSRLLRPLPVPAAAARLLHSQSHRLAAAGTGTPTGQPRSPSSHADGAPSSSGNSHNGSVFVGMVQVMEIRFHSLPDLQLAAQQQQQQQQMLAEGNQGQGGNPEHSSSSSSSSSSPSSHALQSASSSFSSALSSSPLPPPKELPILTAAQLTDPHARMQLWTSLPRQSMPSTPQRPLDEPHAHPSSASSSSASSSSSHPPPTRGQRFIINKKLLPALLLGNQVANGPEILSVAASKVEQETPEEVAEELEHVLLEEAEGIKAEGETAAEKDQEQQKSFNPKKSGSASSKNISSSSSSSSALATSSSSNCHSLSLSSSQLSSLPSLPLGQLVSADTARLMRHTRSTAVQPKRSYPLPSFGEKRLLDAASRGDVETMHEILRSHRLVRGPLEDATAVVEEGEAPTINTQTATAETAVLPLADMSAPPAASTSAPHSHGGRPPLRLNIADPRTGATALHLVSSLGHESCLDLLLSYGPHLDARSSNHATALHWAAGHGHTGIVERLLRAGANPSLRSLTWNHNVFGRGSGQTPAHWAAESGHLDVVKVLHEAHPPSAAMVDERLATPLEVAEKAAQTHVASFLKQVEKEEYVCVELSLKWSGERLMHPHLSHGSSSAMSMLPHS